MTPLKNTDDVCQAPFVVDLKQFPTTRYRGSKRKLLPWLYDHIQQLQFDTALDLFGGTGVVSYLFKRMGKSVTYNDLLAFNHRIGRAIIKNSTTTLSNSDIAKLTSPKFSHGSNDIISKYFKGYYFTSAENRWIDRMVGRLEDSFARPEEVFKKDLAFYALAQTCLSKRPFNLFHRKNLHLREADVERNFGNKTTWDRPIEDTFTLFLNEANRLVFDTDRQCEATSFDALKVPETNFDLVYIDPPYWSHRGDNETSDYRRVYHFLEGLCHYDRWTSMIDFSTCNRRLKQPTLSDPLAASKIEYFEALFVRYRKSTLVVSYKKFGRPSVPTLVRLLKKIKKNVSVHSTHYTYALNGQNGDAIKNRECLIIAK